MMSLIGHWQSFSKKREKVNTLKRNVHILLPIEVVPRELDYKLVFASEMAKFGHKSISW